MQPHSKRPRVMIKTSHFARSMKLRQERKEQREIKHQMKAAFKQQLEGLVMRDMKNNALPEILFGPQKGNLPKENSASDHHRCSLAIEECTRSLQRGP